MLLDRFLPRIDFDSYEDFKKNYKVNVPENFNFGLILLTSGQSRIRKKLRSSGAMTITRKRFLHLRISESFQIKLQTFLPI